jgi:hypothetical protein
MLRRRLSTLLIGAVLASLGFVGAALAASNSTGWDQFVAWESGVARRCGAHMATVQV